MQRHIRGERSRTMTKRTCTTFDTHDEAERFIKRNGIKKASITWAERWFCWVVWYNDNPKRHYI